jgi:hypothetical protein
MKNTITVLCTLVLFIQFSVVSAQNWTTAQIEKANTAKNIEYLTTIEKECVLYINLCRLYPKDFLKNEGVDL